MHDDDASTTFTASLRNSTDLRSTSLNEFSSNPIKYYLLCKKIKHIVGKPETFVDVSKLQPMYEDLAQWFSRSDVVIKSKTMSFKDGVSFDYIPSEIQTHIPSLSNRVQYEFDTLGQMDKVHQQLTSKGASHPEKLGQRASTPSGGRNIKLCIASNTSQQEHSDIISLVYSWFCFLEQHVRKDCSKTLTIYLYLTDCTKKLPEKNTNIKPTELSQNNVNSGFTMACKLNNEIYIFRREEWFKVLLHESMHAMGVDFSWYKNQKPIESILQKEFTGVQIAEWNISECYTEIWAEIINVLIQVYLVTKKQSFYHVKQIVYTALYYESCWSRIQCCKVLKYYGITYQELLSNTTVYQETKTSVFSYYVLKCLLICNIGLFIDWCSERTEGPLTVYRTQKNDTANFSGDPSLRQAELAKAQLLQASPSNSQRELPVATSGGVLADRRSPLRSEKLVEKRLSAPLPDLFSHIFDDETIVLQNMISFGEFLVQLSQDNTHLQQLNYLQHMKIDLGDSLRMSLWSEG